MIGKIISALVTFGEFLLFTVIVKMIVARWIAEQIVKYGGKYATKTERNLAIWTHYQNRAAGRGHAHKKVLECGEQSCAILQT